jgi:hypothetical protein
MRGKDKFPTREGKALRSEEGKGLGRGWEGALLLSFRTVVLTFGGLH